MRAAIIVLLALYARGDAAPKKHMPGALVLVIDRSGSMQGEKIEVAKEATLAAVDALDAADEIAVVTFDSQAQVLVPLQKAANWRSISATLGRLQSGGGTNLFPALKAAFDLLHRSRARDKHVIVITDGESPSDGIVERLVDMRYELITVSTVGVAGADRNFLAMIADAGEGRLYMLEDVHVLSTVLVSDVQAALHLPAVPPVSRVTFDPSWECASFRSWAGCAP